MRELFPIMKMTLRRIKTRKDVFMDFGENLKKARESKGLTQQHLADKLYVTRQAVSRWEGGSRYPDLLTTKCIASILDVSIDSLVSNDEMQEFTQRQSVAQNTKWERLLLVLYSIICAFSFVVLCARAVNLIAFIGNDGFNVLDGNIIISALFPIIMYFAIGLISLVALVKTAKQSAYPRVTGIIGIVLYGVIGTESILRVIVNSSLIENVLLNIAPFALVIAFAAVIGLYFIGNRKKLGLAVMVGAVISIILFIVSPMYQAAAMLSNGYWEQFNCYSYILGGLPQAIIALTVLIQALSLEGKRKATENI